MTIWPQILTNLPTPVVSLGEVIIILPARMEGSESDEEIFISQNRFWESSIMWIKDLI